MGSGFGPVLGALALLVAADILASSTAHWQLCYLEVVCARQAPACMAPATTRA